MNPLKVLIIEDSEDDAVLVVRTLAQAGYEITSKRVASEGALRDALDTATWDVAIADHTMPGFSGTRALVVVREHDQELPFIFVSGTIGEDVAVAAMKRGADDYIMKGNLARLPPAVARELREAGVRRERAKANERLTYLAYHDPMTDLPNRALLHDRLQQAVLAARRDERELTLLVVDLDGFKEINDALGHYAGDLVLQQVAVRLRSTLRESDTVARLGGDEFAILLPFTDLDGGEPAARKIQQELSQPFLIEGRPLIVNASVGIAGYPAHGATGTELLHKADIAMYAAKTGRTGYAMYAPGHDRGSDQRLSLMTAMRQGIASQQFVLEYQPVVDLRSGLTLGVEALIRWEHPDQGRLCPEDFIHLAEHTGLITPLTRFTIERALAEWPLNDGELPFSIAVNLSPRTLHDPALPDQIDKILTTRGAKPSALALEITENLIMSDPEQSSRSLNELHDMGIRLIVDDFGTGYSSLSYLRRLPVDGLKIDQSFVVGLANGEDDALVRSIIDLAHNLRLSVIAEGVETAEVCDQLIALGCDAAQGHHFARPAAAPKIALWLAGQAGLDDRPVSI
ncbi:MAG TPA: EAL domain-containing protein [Vicinamibacterales bacterium]|nr:EAL domain-containing protein [Vicinamibacterales bacterium]